MTKKNYISLIIIALIAIVVVYIEFANKIGQKEEKVIFWDVKSYYGYLPSIIIHQDPKLQFVLDDPEQYGKHFFADTAENGNKVIITSMGLAMLYSPFFLLGHLIAYITGAEMSGFSSPYLYSLLLSSLFYLILGLLCLRKILLKYFSDKITAFTIAGIFAGTNLLWYSTFEATMSHAYSFALFSIFIFYTIKWHEKQNFKNSIITGLIYGLISLIRPTNALIVLFFILYDLKSFKNISSKVKMLICNYKYIITIGIFAFLVIIPQLTYWKIVTDHWFYYSYGNKGNFFFDNPQIINGLFSYRKGWFIYTPLMLIAFLSIPLLFKKENLKQFFIPILFFVILNLYIILSWWSWWYGGGLGLRAFIDSYAIMAIPLAAFFDWSAKSKVIYKFFNFLIATIFILYGIFTNIQYYYGAIHWDSMTKEAYWDSFLRPKPSANLKNLLETPDYEKAMNGIQDIIKPEVLLQTDTSNYTFSNEIFCNAEFIDTEKNMLTTENNDYFFDGFNEISTEKAFSGRNSLKINNEKPYGFATYIRNVSTGEKYLFSVKKSSDSKSCLVVQTDDTNILYQTYCDAFSIENSEWKQISVLFEVTDKLNGMDIKVYCYNPNDQIEYFDDFKISKVK